MEMIRNMTDTNNRGKASWVRWLLLGIILVAQLTVLILAPEEKTLGAGIKPVYLHVSLTWTGMLLLAGSVLLGLWVLAGGNRNAVGWLRKGLFSGFILYGIGFLVSMYASVINWGGVPFGEPAVRQAMGYMLVGVLLWGATHWLQQTRVKGLISSLAALMLLMATESSQSILHPESPVNTSPQSIKATFFIMFGLALLLGIWSIDFQRYVGSRRKNFGQTVN
jgi:hypothetical protein